MATKQEPIRRTDVVRCESCGEDYSITYKRCPFCDERPGRSPRAGTGAVGRRASGSSNPLQVFILILSVALIIAALYIVFTTVAPLLSRREPSQQPDQPSVSQPAQPDSSSTGDISVIPGGDSSAENPGTDTPADPSVSQPGTDVPVNDPVVVTKVNSLSLNKTDFTLAPDETFAFKAKVDPADAKITWSSSNESAAKVSADGVVANVNTGAHQVKVTITAAAGDKTVTCTVYCRGGSSGNAGSSTTPTQPSTPSTPAAPSTPSTPSAPTAPAVPTTPSTPSSGTAINKSGKISGAGNGLNVRSGPGSSNDAIASLNNGTNVTVLEDAGNGWYKISFSGVGGTPTTGYVSGKYVSMN